MSDENIVLYDVIGEDGVPIEERVRLDDARDTARRIVLNGHDEPEIKPSKDQPDSSGVQVEAPAGVTGSSDGAPNKSATREEWDEYARSKGLDPDEYATKDDLIEAAT